MTSEGHQAEFIPKKASLQLLVGFMSLCCMVGCPKMTGKGPLRTVPALINNEALKDKLRCMLLTLNGIKRFTTDDTVPNDIECINGFISSNRVGGAIANFEYNYKKYGFWYENSVATDGKQLLGVWFGYKTALDKLAYPWPKRTGGDLFREPVCDKDGYIKLPPPDPTKKLEGPAPMI